MEIEDFGGMVLRVGDRILSRWLRNSQGNPREEGRSWEHRTVLVVEAVYFLPEKRQHADDTGYTAIVVQERGMTEEEWALL